MPEFQFNTESGASPLLVPAEDSYISRDENGNLRVRPVMASPEEQRQREVDALHRELGGVEFNLAHVDDEVPWRITQEQRAEQRAGLEETRRLIFEKLAALGEPTEKPKPKRRRRG